MTTGKRLRKKMLPVAQKIAAIASPYRLGILYLLFHEDFKMYELADTLRLSAPLCKHHLDALVKEGWVVKNKSGKFAVFHIRVRPIKELMMLLKSIPHAAGKISKEELAK